MKNRKKTYFIKLIIFIFGNGYLEIKYIPLFFILWNLFIIINVDYISVCGMRNKYYEFKEYLSLFSTLKI